MDALRYIEIFGSVISGGAGIKLMDRWLSRRKVEVDTEAAINTMAIKQLEQQMARISQMATTNEKLVLRCDALESTCNDLQTKYNEVILENQRLAQENERLKARITELEKSTTKVEIITNPNSNAGLAR